jgi:hypothetical protein
MLKEEVVAYFSACSRDLHGGGLRKTTKYFSQNSTISHQDINSEHLYLETGVLKTLSNFPLPLLIRCFFINK